MSESNGASGEGKRWARFVALLRGSNVARIGVSLAIVLAVSLGAYGADRLGGQASGDATPTPEPGAGGLLSLSDLPPFLEPVSEVSLGVPRLANGHTEIPSRPRFDIIEYQVQKGDTLFGIADRYGLKPETIFWGNFDKLEGDPHSIRPGQELDILPVDGAAYQWKDGDNLQTVASDFKVTPDDIIDWPGNGLDPAVDLANPPIPDGTTLVIPNGKRDVVDWRSPRITRTNPAVASILGPGACGSIYTGPIGTGGFVWPTSSHWISGYPFIPGVHEAIDIGGAEGNGVYAADSGVVVYAGWNNSGYGYVIVIDHGNGWQTLYAHLSGLKVGCGDPAYQGQQIGNMGCTGNCTGPHLHFEMRSDIYGRVNPINFLPPA
jgi:murein DD-endopeptidase MepM/ murein hydrolase activator NlpD